MIESAGLTFVWDESVVVLGVTALLDEGVHVLPLQFLAQVEQDVLQLLQHHGAVLLLVIELQALHKVLEGTHVLGLLHLGVDGVELLQLDVLLALCPTRVFEIGFGLNF